MGGVIRAAATLKVAAAGAMIIFGTHCALT